MRKLKLFLSIISFVILSQSCSRQKGYFQQNIAQNYHKADAMHEVSPIKTSKGWLEIYHGANSDHRYCLGALLLDLHVPSKVIARSEQPIMEPTADYELKGFFGNVIFTNGHIIEGDTLRLYYGASDEVICSAEFSINEILNSLLIKQK